MNKRLLMFVLAAFFACFLVFLLFNNVGKNSVHGYAMGTPVTVRGKHAKAGLKEIKRLEKLFDKNRVGSDIWLINSLAGTAEVEVSQDTLKVIEQSIKASRLTGGAFDIKQKSGKIDLGGIAKGYAVERAREKLKELGTQRAIIDMVSSIAVIGNPEGRAVWKIGIKDPKNPDQLIGMIELKDGQALSTSGDYERGGHIVDPKTGKAVSGQIASVTVVTNDAGLADALTTAVFVMGKDKGIEMLKNIPVDKYFIVLKDGTIIK